MAGDQEQAIAQLKAALYNYDTYKEAKDLASRGKWANWYRGEIKINVPALYEHNEEVLEKARQGDGRSK